MLKPMQKKEKAYIFKLSNLLVGLLLTSCSPLLTLEKITPVQAPADQENEITIVGSGFTTDIQLSLEATGLKIPLGNIKIVNETTLTATIPSSAPADTYDLTATQETYTTTLPQAFTLLSGTLKIYFLDVHQGDATLIITPENEVILIDGGPAQLNRKLADAIATYTDAPVSLLILSHHDADHLGGIVEYLSGDDGTAGTGDDIMPIKSLAPQDDRSCTSQTCHRFRTLLSYPLERAYVGTTLQMGALSINVVSADGNLGDGPLANELEENEKSVGVVLEYAGRKVLIAGDLTGGGADSLDLETPLSMLTGAIDVLRVSHHGSISSTPQTALTNWSPQVSVISIGTHNSYCHPHPDVVDRLMLESESIWLTGDGPDPESCGHDLPIDEKLHRNQGDILIEIDADGSLRSQASTED